MKVAPVRIERLSDKIVKQVLEMIHDGKLACGEKLPNELQMADMFGVSRGIIREAMTQLQVLGYVTRTPRDGTTISEDALARFSKPVDDALKSATFADLLDFKEALDVKMIDVVVDRASDEELSEIREMLETDKEDNESDINDMNHYFHYALARASKNIFYMNFIDTYYDLLKEMAQQSLSNEGRKKQSINEHFAILAALEKRDKVEGKVAMENHILQAKLAREARNKGRA